MLGAGRGGTRGPRRRAGGLSPGPGSSARRAWWSASPHRRRSRRSRRSPTGGPPLPWHGWTSCWGCARRTRWRAPSCSARSGATSSGGGGVACRWPALGAGRRWLCRRWAYAPRCPRSPRGRRRAQALAAEARAGALASPLRRRPPPRLAPPPPPAVPERRPVPRLAGRRRARRRAGDCPGGVPGPPLRPGPGGWRPAQPRRAGRTRAAPVARATLHPGELRVVRGRRTTPSTSTPDGPQTFALPARLKTAYLSFDFEPKDATVTVAGRAAHVGAEPVPALRPALPARGHPLHPPGGLRRLAPRVPRRPGTVEVLPGQERDALRQARAPVTLLLVHAAGAGLGRAAPASAARTRRVRADLAALAAAYEYGRYAEVLTRANARIDGVRAGRGEPWWSCTSWPACRPSTCSRHGRGGAPRRRPAPAGPGLQPRPLRLSRRRRWPSSRNSGGPWPPSWNSSASNAGSARWQPSSAAEERAALARETESPDARRWRRCPAR